MSGLDALIATVAVPEVLNPGTMEALRADLEAVGKSRARFLVLKGNGNVFCNGLDLRWIARQDPGELPDLTTFAEILRFLQTGPVITFAVVEGEVTGGGMGIVAACDFALAAPSSHYALTEGILGLIPGMILPFLLDKLSPAQIKTMVFTGRKYPAKTMASWGFVHQIVEGDQLEAAVQRLARGMKSCKPHSVAGLKQMLSEASGRRDALMQKGAENLVSSIRMPSVHERLLSILEVLDG